MIQMSDRELTRLRVMVDLADGRLTVAAAASLMCLGRRQVFRLRRDPSNRKHGAIFRGTVVTLVRQYYVDFGPTLAAEKLAEPPAGRTKGWVQVCGSGWWCFARLPPSPSRSL